MPPGVPDFDTFSGRQISMLKSSVAFAAVAESERTAIIGSLSTTIARAEYHYQRLIALRKDLDERRVKIPGEIFWDALVDCVHFELHAFCGAARMTLDELVYLIARRHAVDGKRARNRPWETSDLITTQSLVPECNVSEVHRLRARRTWFGTLNSYRNSYFHHGTRHGSGHFATDDGRAATLKPAMNALLLPDENSLVGRRKPFEWTWNDGKTVDGVAVEIRTGLRELLAEICTVDWQTPEPAPGARPEAEHPNMIVSLITPIIVTTEKAILIPFFTTRERAAAFPLFSANVDLEIVELPVASSVIGQPAVSFTLAGFDSTEVPPGVEWINVVLDPQPRTP